MKPSRYGRFAPVIFIIHIRSSMRSLGAYYHSTLLLPRTVESLEAFVAPFTGDEIKTKTERMGKCSAGK